MPNVSVLLFPFTHGGRAGISSSLGAVFVLKPFHLSLKWAVG